MPLTEVTVALGTSAGSMLTAALVGVVIDVGDIAHIVRVEIAVRIQADHPAAQLFLVLRERGDALEHVFEEAALLSRAHHAHRQLAEHALVLPHRVGETRAAEEGIDFERLALQASKKWTFPPTDSEKQRIMLVRFNFTRAGTTARANSLQ